MNCSKNQYQSRFGEFPYTTLEYLDQCEPDTYSMEEELYYFKRPVDFNEVILRRLELSLQRVDCLERRIRGLEKGIAKLQYRVGRL